MAVDTAARRNSALKFGLLHGLPLPSGSVDDAGRADALFLYRGFYDSGSIPAASFACPQAALYRLIDPRGRVYRLADPQAALLRLPDPKAELRHI